MFEPKGSLEERIDKLEKEAGEVQGYIKRLRESMQEESADRLEDFDQLKLSNIPHIDARTYGMAVDETATKNRVCLQAAVDGAPTGGVVLIPRTSAAYSLDNTTPLAITHGLTLVIQGEVDFSEDDKDFCDVTGDDVTVIGEGGKIKGPGTFDQSGSIASAVFHVTGDRFTCRDLTIEDPVQCGIWLEGSNDDVISGVKIIGGTESGSGSGTANYGIQIDDTSVGISITDIKIVPNASSGVMVQGIAGGSSSQQHITITGCYFEACHDHATYLFGDYHTITGNTFNSIVGSAIKTVGKYGSIIGNTIKDCAKGGIDAPDSDGIVIMGNVIKGYGYVGIDIYDYGSYAGNYDNIIIANNSIEGAASGTVYSGIRLHASSRPAENIQIINNTIQDADSSGDDYHGIWVLGTDPGNGNVIKRVKIDGNIIDTIGRAGIAIAYISSGSISNNLILNPGQQTDADGIWVYAGSDDIYIANNRIIGDSAKMLRGILVTAGDAGNSNCILENNKITGDTLGEIVAPTAQGHQLFITDSSGIRQLVNDFYMANNKTIKFRNFADDAWWAIISLSSNDILELGAGTIAGVVVGGIKSGTTQAAAGATLNELWVDTDDDNTIKLGAST